jgi:hypothetical protein
MAFIGCASCAGADGCRLAHFSGFWARFDLFASCFDGLPSGSIIVVLPEVPCINRLAGFSCAHAARRRSWYAANVTHGQSYCAAACADITRLSRQREAGKRYQQSRAAAAK